MQCCNVFKKWESSSPEETICVGRNIAQFLFSPIALCLIGDLGAGKTTLMKGIASEFTGISPCIVNSPTFTYLNIYEGIKTLYHFDLYRLQGASDFLSRGFDEYFEEICCIEWAEKIEELLPPKRVIIRLRYLGESKREITYEI